MKWGRGAIKGTFIRGDGNCKLEFLLIRILWETVIPFLMIYSLWGLRMLKYWSQKIAFLAKAICSRLFFKFKSSDFSASKAFREVESEAQTQEVSGGKGEHRHRLKLSTEADSDRPLLPLQKLSWSDKLIALTTTYPQPSSFSGSKLLTNNLPGFPTWLVTFVFLIYFKSSLFSLNFLFYHSIFRVSKEIWCRPQRKNNVH